MEERDYSEIVQELGRLWERKCELERRVRELVNSAPVGTEIVLNRASKYPKSYRRVRATENVAWEGPYGKCACSTMSESAASSCADTLHFVYPDAPLPARRRWGMSSAKAAMLPPLIAGLLLLALALYIDWRMKWGSFYDGRYDAPAAPRAEPDHFQHTSGMMVMGEAERSDAEYWTIPTRPPRPSEGDMPLFDPHGTFIAPDGKQYRLVEVGDGE